MKLGVGHHTERIDDRGDIHPQADNVAEEHLDIPVLGRNRGDNHTATNGKKGQQDYKKREEDDGPGWGDMGTGDYIV